MEENSGEDGLLIDVIEGEDEKQKITEKSIKAQLKEIGKDKDYQDEINALESYLKLINKHKNIKTKLKSEKQNLDKKIKDKYSNLNNKEIISLVVEKKWIAVLSSNLDEELINIFKILTKRLNILAERYSKSYPIMLKNLSNATEVVEKHLKKMGFK